jgi:hypothetical protein
MRTRRSDGFRSDLVSSIELHPYSSESWWTATGARKKERRLRKAGLPNFRNWRFVTLTMADRETCAPESYVRGKDRIRRFLACFRTALGRRFLWCWKLEFHHDDDGYPHWHLLIEYRKKIPEEVLIALERWWGLGRINVRRVKAQDIGYLFKYVTKAIEEVPQWVGAHKGRIRVFQTSRGFYTEQRPRMAKREKAKATAEKIDLFTRMEADKRKARMVMTDLLGNSRHRVAKLKTTFNALLLERANESIKRRVQLAPPGVVNISQLEASMLTHE